MVKALIARIQEFRRERQEKLRIERANQRKKHVQEYADSLRGYKQEDIVQVTDEKKLNAIQKGIHFYISLGPDELREEAQRLWYFTFARLEDVVLAPGLREMGRPTMLEEYQSGWERIGNQGVVDYYLMAHGVDLSEQFAQEQARVERARKEPITPAEQYELDQYFSNERIL